MTNVEFEVITDKLAFPEGPIAMRDGSVICVEICGQRLTRVFPNGKLEIIAELEGGPNGAAMGPNGWCYICNSGGWVYETIDGARFPIGQSTRRGWIERVNIETGDVERLYDGVGEACLNSPNDIVFASTGDFWFTDLGKRGLSTRDVGAVYYAKADGSHIEQAITNLYEPNGIGLSSDERTLYVSETVARRVCAYQLSAPGKVLSEPIRGLAGGRLIAGLPDRNNLDSLAIDGDGNICVASLFNGGIWELSPSGEHRKHYSLPDIYTTNICFGGEKGDEAFVTLSSSGRLIRFKWPRAGQRLNFEY